MRTQKLIPESLKEKKKKKVRIGLELFCALDSSLLVRFIDISNLFTWNFLKYLFGFKLIAPSTSSNFKWHSMHLIEFSLRHSITTLYFQFRRYLPEYF